MPTSPYTQTLSALYNHVINYTPTKLIWLDQYSPEHLRFIPEYLDLDSKNNRGRNLIKKTSTVPANTLGKKMKREVYLEFKDQSINPFELILVVSGKSNNILQIARNNTSFSVKAGGNGYFHVKNQAINKNNLQSDFNTYIPIFLNLLNVLYP